MPEEGVRFNRPRIHKTARVKDGSIWKTVYHNYGVVPIPDWIGDSPLIRIFGRIVKLRPHDIAKLLETTGSPHSSEKQVWLAIPGQGALEAISMVTFLANMLKKQRRTTSTPPSTQREKMPDHIRRPPLDGGRLW